MQVPVETGKQVKKRRRVDVFVWLTITFLVLIVTLIADNLSDSVYDQIEEEYATYQGILAESSAKTLRLFFGEVGTELRLLARMKEVSELRLTESFLEMENIIARHEDLISTILLVDYKGDILADPRFPDHAPELKTQLRKLYRHILTKVENATGEKQDYQETTISDKIIISGQFAGFALAVPVIKTVRETLRGDYRAVNGMVVALISKHQLEKNLLEPIGFKEGSAAFIVTHTLVGLASPTSRERILGIVKNLGNYPVGEDLIGRMMAGEEGTFWRVLFAEIDGKQVRYPVLVSFSPAKFSNVTWSVGILTPQNEITKLVQESRLKSLLLAAFVTTVFYFGAIVLIRLNRVRVAAQEKAKYATELAEKNIELEKLNKMKDDFVSIVSHDLRSPIGIISSYAKMLLPEAEKKCENIKPIQAIISSSDRLLTLVNDILDLARIEAGKLKLHPTEIGVDDLVRESFRAVKFNAEQKGIELIYKADPDPKTVIADNSKLYQVLNNLIVNAIKFTPENGKVTVLKTMDNGNLKIGVADTGPGLSEDEQSNIFEKFKTTGSQEGLGLGLAICKNMVELHGGKIWVESPPEFGARKGAEFIFTIPLVPAVETDD
jgi:signal transduction histidine kinase